jgi:hypothetical protein
MTCHNCPCVMSLLYVQMMPAISHQEGKKIGSSYEYKSSSWTHGVHRSAPRPKEGPKPKGKHSREVGSVGPGGRWRGGHTSPRGVDREGGAPTAASRGREARN